MFRKISQKSAELKADKQGGEALEFLNTFWWLILIAMALVLMFAYVFRAGQLNYICKRAVHTVETTGVYDTSKVQQFASSLYCDNLPITVDCFKTSNASGTAIAVMNSGDIIQYKDTFVIQLTTTYKLSIFKANLTYPVRAVVHGVSEVYTKPTGG